MTDPDLEEFDPEKVSGYLIDLALLNGIDLSEARMAAIVNRMQQHQFKTFTAKCAIDLCARDLDHFPRYGELFKRSSLYRPEDGDLS